MGEEFLFSEIVLERVKLKEGQEPPRAPFGLRGPCVKAFHVGSIVELGTGILFKITREEPRPTEGGTEWLYYGYAEA